MVRRILEANSFRLQNHFPRGDAGFDFVGRVADEDWAIEVKYYRTARAQPTLIESAAARVVNDGKGAQLRKGMLVISCILPLSMRPALERKFGITILDRGDLRNWATADPSLVDELDAIVESRQGLSINAQETRADPLSKTMSLEGVASPPQESRGAQLCDELDRVKRGKEAWAAYEGLCTRILEYLFPNDLHGWHKQKRTDDGLNRFDFVCRVRPTTDFWNFLIEHLDSRYVLFEFKNYTGKIKQGQILTTEKYLLERGLRKVALVFTRGGAEKDAMKMTQGAMREHGKLMLVLDDAQICKMLNMKDRGEDPSDLLFDLTDDFLLSLPR
ncbi:MAG: hypothetical protein GTN93_28035 [Anaerolineae bacterium]|nr:hypothetical protein [Anaerolineae bacterium]